MADVPRSERPPRTSRVTRILIALPFVLVVGVLAAAVLAGFVAAVVIGVLMPGPSKDLLARSTSPDGRWTVRAYDHDPGAMASDWVTIEVVDNTGKQPTWQVAEPDGAALAEPNAWSGNRLRVTWKTATTAIGSHDYSVVKPWWRVPVPDPPLEWLVPLHVAASAAIGVWCYRLWRRKGRPRWIGAALGLLVSLLLTPVAGLACVSVGYGLRDRAAGPGARSHMLAGVLVGVGIVAVALAASQLVIVPT